MWRRIFPIRGFPTIKSQSFFEASLRPSVSSARNHLFDRSTFSPSIRSSSSSYSSPPNSSVDGSPAAPLSCMETKRLLRLVNVEELKKRLEVEGEEVIHYSDLLKECQSLGVSKSCEEAEDFAKVLDEAGVVLLFRDKVYLHPDKVVELVSRAMPLALTPESDPRRLELKKLREMKEEIDMVAHKQVRRILWAGLGFFVVQISLFFRLTFWEFSWDVMEPIAFFGTTSGLLIGYAYFLFTSRDPTYQDLLKRLFLSRQRIIFKKRNFDASRFKELQRQLKSPLECIKEVEPILKG